MCRVLIVDDEPDFHYLLGYMFENQSVETFGAYDVTDALHLIEKLTSIGLIIVDIHLPKISGFYLLRMLTDIYPAIPVVMTSVITSHEVTQKAFNSGAVAFLKKPFTRSHFLEVVSPFMRPCADTLYREWRMAKR
jgi:CheY-like chemotaxis protein